MRLLRFGPVGAEKPGLLDASSQIRDLSGYVDDIGGATLGSAALAELAKYDPEVLPLVGGSPRIGACVANVGKFIAIGLNYSDHAAETGLKIPGEPIVFMKSTTSICGPDDAIEIPRGSEKTDWEVELGVVIGTLAKYVTEDQAMDHVAGYCTVNDGSERDFQAKRWGQWTKGKSHDTFGPIGPWLVTRDEIKDPQALRLTADVDGHRYQDGTTATMIYPVAHLVSYLSQFMTLMPGDIVATGTPPGVGMGVKPDPVYLKSGQTLRLEVDGLGAQTHKTVQA